jgi:hypothetical protein
VEGEGEVSASVAGAPPPAFRMVEEVSLRAGIVPAGAELSPELLPHRVHWYRRDQYVSADGTAWWCLVHERELRERGPAAMAARAGEWLV